MHDVNPQTAEMYQNPIWTEYWHLAEKVGEISC